MIRSCLTSLVLLASAGLASAAPTESEQRAACTADVMRLCLAQVPNRDRVADCMTRKRSALSASCKVVFDASLAAKRRVQ